MVLHRPVELARLIVQAGLFPVKLISGGPHRALRLAASWLSWRRGSWLYDGCVSAIDNRIPVGRRVVAIVGVLFHAVDIFDAVPSDGHVDWLGQRDRILQHELDLHPIV